MKIAVLTGAGVSAESGISTFRDANGLWEGHDVMEVASPQGFRKNPELVLDFYNQRRRQLFEVEPNKAHLSLASLEMDHQVDIITQNVDDLHERAGSSQIIHLHGELRKSRSTGNPSLIYNCDGDIKLGDICEEGFQLRPHIVWFGESVPLLEAAIPIVANADMTIIIGTSMQVYPAASLVHYTKPGCGLYYVDPKPELAGEFLGLPNLRIIADKAGTAIPNLVRDIKTKKVHH